ncbi:MAG: thioredoxin family protein [Anaerolineae bacterium]|nr:thioredoxin family protein [Anaerolineae bacterium]
MKPIVDGLEQKYGGQIAVQRINATEGDGPAVMKAYHILGHPVVLIFDRQGQEVKRFVGPQPTEVVEEVLQDTLKR